MFIGIDMGGTKIAAGLVDKGRILKRITIPTEAEKGKAHILNALKLVIAELSKGRKITAIGMGVPGRYRGTRIVHLPNVSCLDGVDLKKALGIKVKFAVENDARCFLLAEHSSGAAKGAKNCIGVTLGTGVGGGIIIDNKHYHGRGGAGEFGQARLLDERKWEEIISGTAIMARYRGRGGTEARVSDIWKGKDVLAQQTREESVALTALLIADLIIIFDPDVVVLGGGVSNVPLVKPVNEMLKKRGLQPILRQSKLGIDAGILGAVEASKH